MSLLSLVGVLLVIGILLGLINRFGSRWVDSSILSIINGVVIVTVILWLLQLFGVISALNTVHIGH